MDDQGIDDFIPRDEENFFSVLLIIVLLRLPLGLIFYGCWG